MATLRSAPMWRRPRLEKRTCLAMKDGQGLSSYITCSEKKCPEYGWPRAFGAHRKPSAIDTATRQRGLRQRRGDAVRQCGTQFQGHLPASAVPWPTELACPSHYSLGRAACRSLALIPYVTSTTLNRRCRVWFGTALTRVHARLPSGLRSHSSPHMINSTHQKSPALGQPFAPVIPLLKNLISPALFSQRVRYTCLDPKREQDLQHIDTRYRGIPLPPAAARFARRGAVAQKPLFADDINPVCYIPVERLPPLQPIELSIKGKQYAETSADNLHSAWQRRSRKDNGINARCGRNRRARVSYSRC